MEAAPGAEADLETDLLLAAPGGRRDSSISPATVRIKLGLSPFLPTHSFVIFWSHAIQSELAGG